MRLLIIVLAMAVNVALIAPAWSKPVVRVAVLKFGTVNWELNVMKEHGLDEKAGIELKIIPLASTQATKVAFQSGTADIVVTDWMWVSRQRTQGADYAFIPYSTAVGAIMVPEKSPVKKLTDLKGKKIGVAGGPLDKNWLFLVAVAAERGDIDLKKSTRQIYGAAPLLAEKAAQGEIDGVLNYWHYCARLEARGFRRLAEVQDAAQELGAKGRVSAIGYVFSEKWAAKNAKELSAFVDAVRRAKQILNDSDQEWDRIRALTQAKDEKTLQSLRERYREGIPNRSADEEETDAKTLFKVLKKFGGRKLVGAGNELANGTFWNGG